MDYRWLVRGAFVIAAGFATLSCGGGGMTDTGAAGTFGAAGHYGILGGGGTGGSAGSGAGGTAGSGSGGGAIGTAGTTGTTGEGGGGPVTACGTVQPCGGSPIDGLWTFTAECVDVGEYTLIMQQELGCLGAKVTAVDVNNSLSHFSFGPDSYNLLENITARITFDMPKSCAGASPCRDWATIQSLTAGAAYSCGENTTSCLCTETFSDSSSDNGTYNIGAGHLFLTSSVTGVQSDVGYCIQGGGSTIHFITVDPSMHTGPGGGPTIFKDVVATKS